MRKQRWGALALSAAIVVSNAPESQFGLAAAIGDALSNGLSNSSLLRAILLNAQMVEAVFRELFGFFLVSCLLLALLALLAFTKGEWLERTLRPTILALMGFIAGSVATLAVVTIGFGGFSRPQVFSATLAEVSTITLTDADTFRIGDFNLRLYGADALEHDQECNGFENRNCGTAAKEFLTTLLANGVQCDQTLSRRGRPRDSLGRALVRCAYFRYRGVGGDDVNALSAVIALPAHWNLAILPKSLTDDEVNRLLNAFPPELPSCRRGYAMVRCALDLGLHIGEIAKLALADIDWEAGTITLRGTKSRREDILPLPISTGQAIADYLRYERPRTTNQAVFVRRLAPHDVPIMAYTVHRLIRDAYHRFGLDHGRTHALRHTLLR